MLTILPFWLAVLFVLITLFSVYLFYSALTGAEQSERVTKSIITVAGLWLGLQGFLALRLFYQKTIHQIPPGILRFGLLPLVLLIIGIFITRRGRRWTDTFQYKDLTAISLVRIPVELVLFFLARYGAIPTVMSIEGFNFDLVSGIVALIITIAYRRNKQPSKGVLISFNVFGIITLLTIMMLALLSAPSPLQKLAFDQPNKAVLFFPFVWLPVFIAPLVLFSHLVALRKIVTGK